MTQEPEHIAANALITAGQVIDPWGPPIHAVGRAVGLLSSESRKLVRAMLLQGVVCIRTRALPDQAHLYSHLSWWEAVQVPSSRKQVVDPKPAAK
jgi:hypothetical protein